MLDRLMFLVRWLGPWASQARRPGGVRRQTLRIDAEQPGEQPFDGWLYTPERRPIEGALLMSPGVHYLGAADARMVRLATVLAASGIAVLSPFMPDYLRLLITQSAISDLQRAFRVFRDRPEVPAGLRPGVFSISFGSLPALRLISDLPDEVGGALVFGGYADWNETCVFCLTGELGGVQVMARDPLNQPIIYMNLIEDLPGAPEDTRPIMEAWMRYVQATWGRDRYKRGGHHLEVAHAIAPRLPAADREIFLKGCGDLQDDHALARAALVRRGERLSFLNPLVNIHRARCPVHLAHGVDDDVIPVNQLDRLAAAIPAGTPVTTYKTGFYSHSGRSPGLADKLPVMARDVQTMVRMMGAILSTSSDAGRRGGSRVWGRP